MIYLLIGYYVGFFISVIVLWKILYWDNIASRIIKTLLFSLFWPIAMPISFFIWIDQ